MCVYLSSCDDILWPQTSLEGVKESSLRSSSWFRKCCSVMTEKNNYVYITSFHSQDSWSGTITLYGHFKKQLHQHVEQSNSEKNSLCHSKKTRHCKTSVFFYLKAALSTLAHVYLLWAGLSSDATEGQRLWSPCDPASKTSPQPALFLDRRKTDGDRDWRDGDKKKMDSENHGVRWQRYSLHCLNHRDQ